MKYFGEAAAILKIVATLGFFRVANVLYLCNYVWTTYVYA